MPKTSAVSIRRTAQGLALGVSDCDCAWCLERIEFAAVLILKPLGAIAMRICFRISPLLLIFALAAPAFCQQKSRHVLSSDELKKATPSEYFFRGQKAPVQLRNAVGFQLADGKMVLAALVDASGYSTAIQQRYQGMLITEARLNIGGSSLPAGQYGFGFTSDGKFMVMDVGNNDVVSTSSQADAAVQHAVPLKLVEDGDGYKLYAGKNWVGIKAE